MRPARAVTGSGHARAGQLAVGGPAADGHPAHAGAADTRTVAAPGVPGALAEWSKPPITPSAPKYPKGV